MIMYREMEWRILLVYCNLKSDSMACILEYFASATIEYISLIHDFFSNACARDLSIAICHLSL